MRVSEASEAKQNDVQADICRAIADGAVTTRAKLERHTTKRMTSRNTVLKGESFHIPTDLKPEDLNWRESRPLKPWVVRPEAHRLPGLWNLEWIELLQADVTNVLCATRQNGKPAQKMSGKMAARRRSRPTFERAQLALETLYPAGAPTQADVPNKILCEEIAQWLKNNGRPRVSDDSILRAAGRRK